MVTQFSSVCLNRKRDDNKFLEHDTGKGHMKGKCFQCSISTYWNKSILKIAKNNQMLSRNLKSHFFSCVHL